MDMHVFAKRLRATRENLGISAKELAEALGINATTIYRYETAEFKGVKASLLTSIAEYLNVNPDYLIGATDQKHTTKEAEDLASTMTDLEKQVLEKLRSVPVAEQQRALDVLEALLNKR